MTGFLGRQVVPRGRKGFVTFLVLWSIALAAVVLTTLQSISHKQAVSGRMAAARVRAYWAARAGIEAQIAVLTADTLAPSETSALQVMDDLAAAGRGSLRQASFVVTHAEGGKQVDGAADAHARLNINAMSPESLALLIDTDDSTVDAIIDWIDEDDQPSDLGAEEGQYLSKKFPYRPRNAPVRSLRELELVLGVSAEQLRGEDWNLNGRLDPGEDDGDLSWPPDNADGQLDAGWSAHLTAVSERGVGPGYGLSGQPRLELSQATAEDVARRLSIDVSQAQVIVNHVADGGTLVDFIDTDLSSLANGGVTQLNGQRPSIPDLTDEQIGTLLAETYVAEETVSPRTGKLNINTVDEETLEYLAELTPGVADAIITERNARSGGFVRLTDLLEVPAIDKATLAELYPYLDVRSEIFIASSRGRDELTGLQVEIQAVLDRSTVPVIIKDVTIR